MKKLTCHCGGVEAEVNVPEKFEKVIRCNCSICNRKGYVMSMIGDNDLKIMGNNNTVNEQVEKLSKIAKELEVGVICSGHEAKFVRKIIGPNLLIFTPGIRMAEDGKNDQKRICTPSESIKNGADKIIINSAVRSKPEIVRQIIDHHGSQSVVASIDYKIINQEPKLFLHLTHFYKLQWR